MATNHSPNISVRHSLIAATVGAGIALAIVGHLSAASAQSYDRLPVSASVGVLQEDDPGWSCLEDGNLICGDPQGTHASTAWDAWDRTQGWRRLKVDTSRPFRVDYVGYATHSPKIDPLTEVAVPSRSNWYVFRAVPATPATGTEQVLPL